MTSTKVFNSFLKADQFGVPTATQGLLLHTVFKGDTLGNTEFGIPSEKLVYKWHESQVTRKNPIHTIQVNTSSPSLLSFGKNFIVGKPEIPYLLKRWKDIKLKQHHEKFSSTRKETQSIKCSGFCHNHLTSWQSFLWEIFITTPRPPSCLSTSSLWALSLTHVVYCIKYPSSMQWILPYISVFISVKCMINTAEIQECQEWFKNNMRLKFYQDLEFLCSWAKILLWD